MIKVKKLNNEHIKNYIYNKTGEVQGNLNFSYEQNAQAPTFNMLPILNSKSSVKL